MNFNLHDLVLLLPENFLLGAICAILFIDLFLKPAQRDITHWLSIAALLGTISLVLIDHDPAKTGMLGGELYRGFLRRGLHAPEQIVALVQFGRIVRRLGRMHRRHLGPDRGKIADQPVDVGRGQLVRCARHGQRGMRAIG